MGKQARYASFEWKYETEAPAIVEKAVQYQEDFKNCLEPWEKFLKNFDLEGKQPSLRIENGVVVSNYDIDISILQETVGTLIKNVDCGEVIITDDSIFIDFSPIDGIAASIVYFENPKGYVNEDDFCLGGNWYYFETIVSTIN